MQPTDKSDNGEMTMRLFVAIKPSTQLVGALARFRRMAKARQVLASLKWVEPSFTHLTVQFIGDVESGRSAGVQSRLATALERFEPLRITTQKPIFLPTAYRPRTACVAIQLTPQLAEIKNAIEDALASPPLSSKTENRTFKPHITYGRLRIGARFTKDDETELSHIWKTALRAEGITWLADTIELYQSILQPTRALHTLLRSYNLR